MFSWFKNLLFTDARHIRQENYEETLDREALSPEDLDKLREALDSLRRYERRQDLSDLREHQLEVQLSMAYSLGAAPKAWELYALADSIRLPLTAFCREHREEVIRRMEPLATADLLAHYAEEKILAEYDITDDEREEFHSYAYVSGKIKYYDPEGGWKALRGINIQWLDDREMLRDMLSDEPGSVRTRIEDRLRDLESAKDNHPRALQEYMAHQAYMNSHLYTAHVLEEPRMRERCAAYLRKLEKTSDFRKVLFRIIRLSENELRSEHEEEPVSIYLENLHESFHRPKP